MTQIVDFVVLEGMAQHEKSEWAKEIGRRLRAAREVLGLGQNELAKLIGAGDAPQGGKRLSNWESGEREFPAAFAVEMSHKFGFTTDYFYRDTRTGFSPEMLTAIEKALAGVQPGKARRGRPFGKGASSSSSQPDVEEKTIAPPKRQRRRR